MDYGIDGCKGGWAVVGINDNGSAEITVYATVGDFWAACGHGARRVWIDMPIGLPSTTPRLPEQHARNRLGLRRSSVFSVPVRAAFEEASYHAACTINQRYTGKKFSKQMWHIMPKIHELDLFLRENPNAREIFLEGHPELAFMALNSGTPMAYSKKHPLGFLDRLNLLKTLYPDAEKLLRAAVAQPITDDVVDALMLALAARNGAFISLPDSPEIDLYGLPMRIAYPQFDTVLD